MAAIKLKIYFRRKHSFSNIQIYTRIRLAVASSGNAVLIAAFVVIIVVVFRSNENLYV